MTKKILIIGAGLAGLSAGIYARKNDFEVEIFEQHTMPGGVCTGWAREGFKTDACIHWLMGMNKESFLRKVYDEVGAFEGLTPVLLDRFSRYAWMKDDGTPEFEFEITRDLEKFKADWLKLSPTDQAPLDELVRGIRAFQTFNVDWSPPTGAMRFLYSLKFFWSIRKQFMYFGRYKMTVREFAAKIEHPFLRWLLESVFLPDMPVFFMMMILGELTAGKLGYPREGSLKFSLAIAKRLQALGGKIHYKSDVTKILVENNRAVGIRLADGSEHRGDIVISAADLHDTLYKLLDNQFTDRENEERFKRWPLFTPIIMMNFGVKRTFPADMNADLNVRMPSTIDTGNYVNRELNIKWFHHYSHFAPDGCTTGMVILGADFDYWENLVKDRPAYLAAKERILSETIGALEVLYPGISSQIVMKDLSTPLTFVHYTRNYRGAWEGWLMTPEAFNTRVSKTLPGLKGFYLAGQWVEPGGGVPTALMSGRNIIQQIIQEK